MLVLVRGWLQRLKDDRVQGALWLALAAGLAGLLALVAVPFVTSLYLPATYGAYALVLAFGMVLSTLATGRYEMLCVVAPHDPNGERTSGTAARLAVGIDLASSGVVMMLVLGFVAIRADSLTPDQQGLWLAGPVMMCLSGLAVVQSLVDTRRGNFRLLAFLTLIRAAGVPVGQVLMGQWWPNAWGLLLPTMVMGLVPVARLTFLIATSPRIPAVKYRDFAREHRKYPVYQVPAALANSLSTSTLLFSLTAAYSVASAGIFSVGTRISGFPATLIGGPVNSVYFREAARISNDRRRARRLYVRVTLLMAGAGVGCYLVLLLALPFLVGFLGPEWSQARVMIIATIPLGLAAIVSSTPNSTLITYGHQGLLLAWRVALISLPPLVVLGCAFFGIQDSVAVLAAGVVLLAGATLYAWRGVGVIDRGPSEGTGLMPRGRD